MAGVRSLAALLVLLGLGCAPRLPVPSSAEGRGLLSGRGRITLSAGHRGISAPCAFVLDGASGRARVEIREPMGTTRLVLFLSPAEARLWEPTSGAWALWMGAADGLPFAPSDLWAALRALPPVGARGRTEGQGVRASWRNGAGRVRGWFGEREGEKVVRLEGPHRSRLELRSVLVPVEAVAAGALLPPEFPEADRLPPGRLLGEGVP